MARAVAWARLAGFAFLLLAIPLCIVLAVVVPPGEVPDEGAHLLRAASILSGQIFGQRHVSAHGAFGRSIVDAGFKGDPALIDATHPFPDDTPMRARKVTTARLRELRQIPWSGSFVFEKGANVAVYSPVLYVPEAAAIGIGRMAGLGPYATILLARIANALVYGAIGFAALCLARWGRALLLAALLLPMSLSLAASCSQDGLMIATACLAAALLTRPARRAWLWAGGLIACIIAARIAYLPLCAVMLCGGDPLSRDIGRRLRACLLVALPGLAWVMLGFALAAVPFQREAYLPGPLWSGDPNLPMLTTSPLLQLHILLADPRRLVLLPLHTMLADWNVELWMMVGVLGPLTVPIDLGLRDWWLWALAAASLGCILGDHAAPPAMRGRNQAIAGIAVLASIFALFLVMYLSWANVGAELVQGIQGRYFIPLIPFIALALPRLRIPHAAALRLVAAVPVLLLAAWSTGYLPALLIGAYDVP